MIILKFEKIEEGTNISKTQYEVHYPQNGSFIQLNLSICFNIKVDIFDIIDINSEIVNFSNIGGYELYPMSNYYDDICFTTSENNTDIALGDLKNDDLMNETSKKCGENCVPYYYNNNSLICSCSTKNIKTKQNAEEKFDKNKIIKNFVEVNKFANLHLLRCYKKVFKLNNLKKNYGFYIYIFSSYILCLLHFCFKFYLNHKNDISKLIDKKEKTFKSENDGRNLKTRKFNSKIKIKKKHKKLKNSKSKFMTTKETIKSKTSYEKESILEYNSDEFNSLSYEDALIYDKRNYCQYYCSLIKLNHIIIFSFYCNKKDYNSQIIKIFLFFFSFGADMAFNALFYDADEYITHNNQQKGKYDLIYQFPTALYSSIIPLVLNFILKNLAFTDNLILDIKFEKKVEEFKKKKQNIYKKIKIRFILFFIISFLLISFFLFFVSCFCGVYINSQFYLISESLISLIISVFAVFYQLLIPGFFRIYALRAKNKDKKCLYNFSQFLEL